MQQDLGLRSFFEACGVMINVRDGLPVTIMKTFLGVAIWGFNNPKDTPLTITELSEKIGLPMATTSYHLRYLGDFERIGVPGLGLVKTAQYVLNRRQKVVSLTPKGKALASQLMYLMQGPNGNHDVNTTQREKI